MWFETTRVYKTQTGIIPPNKVDVHYKRKDPAGKVIYTTTLTATGELIVEVNFGWNGPTFVPNFDCMMRGSAAHDAIYIMFCEAEPFPGHPSGHAQTGMTEKVYKPQADAMLTRMFHEDGCSDAACFTAGQAVYLFGSWFNNWKP